MGIDIALLTTTLVTSLTDVMLSICVPILTGTCSSDCCGTSVSHTGADTVMVEKMDQIIEMLDEK
jgi:hypothetical protein